MKRMLTVSIAALLFLSPTTAPAEKDQVTACYSGAYRMFQGSSELEVVMWWDADGVFTDESGKGPLHGAKFHSEGVQRGVDEATREGFGYDRTVDKDGDIIISQVSYTGMVSIHKALEGTGKYKGISGSTKSERISSDTSVPGKYKVCRRFIGTFKMPK